MEFLKGMPRTRPNASRTMYHAHQATVVDNHNHDFHPEVGIDPRSYVLCAMLFCTSFIRYILHYYTTCTSSSRNKKFGEFDNIPSEKKVKERKRCCIGRRRRRSEPYVFTTDGEPVPPSPIVARATSSKSRRRARERVRRDGD